ncbi:MAG TPA: cache domain-containing protein [Aromatoleum sp.]|uniref:cache domain-containing protein n=1 Tax=Aromatoleum sp. TaxID=2307007 RepID=UPI002B49EA92|nr:cache domain-containing protein [Aromatoleum sp.]HJV26076.1 cache domain-containing protein [Aromatoleum sp.]
MTRVRIQALLCSLSMLAGAALAAPAAEDSATPEDAVTKVWAAAKFLQTKGVSGISAFNSKDGPWVWKDSYVFVFDCRLDRMVAHPLRPDLVGRPIMQVTDNNGRYIFAELCKAATQPRGGWVEYAWPKPGAGGASRKVSYAVTADMAFSAGIQVGAGIYDEKLTPVALNKLVETLADPDKYPAH